MGTRFSTELSRSSGAAAPTTLKKRSDVPKLPSVLMKSVTLDSAWCFESPYGEIGFLSPSSLQGSIESGLPYTAAVDEKINFFTSLRFAISRSSVVASRFTSKYSSGFSIDSPTALSAAVWTMPLMLWVRITLSISL